LQHANTRELHLRFSLGRWDAESWGARPWGGEREGGTGVELWAWVEASSDAEADQRWLTLTNALSGLFCASLNFIDSTRTTRPVMSFQPSGSYANKTIEDLHLLHGTLPREVVCTENLTPFLKLLPCKGKAGISSLLDGHKLFDSSWQSMSIDVKPVCGNGTCHLQITQTIDMVLDIQRSKRPRGELGLGKCITSKTKLYQTTQYLDQFHLKNLNAILQNLITLMIHAFLWIQPRRKRNGACPKSSVIH
jgi:phosphatidylinositol glycan class T